MTESFNYISIGNKEVVASEPVSVRMTFGRLFEYTPVDIEKRISGLDTASVEFIEDLPTFVCSEIDTDGKASMLVKYGRVFNVKKEWKQVTASFETLVDFGEVQFESGDAARAVFEVDRFQLYRTHWAVRNGSAASIIEKLLSIKPQVAQLAQEAAENIFGKEAVEPPPRNKNILGSAETVEEFLSLLFKFPAAGETETFFRGHSDARYELTPSLLRKWENGDWQFMPSEDILCKELLIAHDSEFQADHFRFDQLVRMQHYGLPTRLLDISGNPLVALFFACSGRADQAEIDGEVIILDIDKDTIKYYDSDTVSCISNISNLTISQKNQIDLEMSEDDFNKTDVGRKLVHHIRSEKAFFENRIVPDDLGAIVCTKAKRTNSRIKSQSGAFLLFGHEASLPDAGKRGIEVKRIVIKNKASILHQLDRININATTVYPSIDQTAVHLRDLHQSPPPDRVN